MDFLSRMMSEFQYEAELRHHFVDFTVTVRQITSGEWFATVSGDLTNKGHDTVGAVSSILNYGAVLLAQILAAFSFGTYNGPSGYNPLI